MRLRQRRCRALTGRLAQTSRAARRGNVPSDSPGAAGCPPGSGWAPRHRMQRSWESNPRTAHICNDSGQNHLCGATMIGKMVGCVAPERVILGCLSGPPRPSWTIRRHLVHDRCIRGPSPPGSEAGGLQARVVVETRTGVLLGGRPIWLSSVQAGRGVALGFRGLYGRAVLGLLPGCCPAGGAAWVLARTPRDAATSGSVVAGGGAAAAASLVVDRLAGGIGRVESVLVLERFPEFALGAVDLGGELVDPLVFGSELAVEAAQRVLEADDQAGGGFWVSPTETATLSTGTPTTSTRTYGWSSRYWRLAVSSYPPSWPTGWLAASHLGALSTSVIRLARAFDQMPVRAHVAGSVSQEVGGHAAVRPRRRRAPIQRHRSCPS
jgi:hypothetical protein